MMSCIDSGRFLMISLGMESGPGALPIELCDRAVL